MRGGLLIFIAVAHVLTLAGCSARQRVAELPHTFLEGAPFDHKIARVPFEQAWGS